jgi:hypothetical protein
MWIDIIKLIIKNHQSYLSLAEEAKEFQRAHLALSKQRQQANVRSRRLRLLQSFEKKLQEFQFNEDARLDNVVQSQVNDAMRFANETVQKDAKVQFCLFYFAMYFSCAHRLLTRHWHRWRLWAKLDLRVQTLCSVCSKTTSPDSRPTARVCLLHYRRRVLPAPLALSTSHSPRSSSPIHSCISNPHCW